MPSERPDGDQTEHFLVDGVAPAVIGGGPPESPFELEPDPEPEPRHRASPYGQPGPSYEHAASARREPPTAPIPVINPLPSEPAQGKRRSWVSRVFRLPGD